MLDKSIKPPTVFTPLRDGMVLRNASTQDQEALADLLSHVHASPTGEANNGVRAWQRDLFSLGHPTLSPADMLVVEDTEKGILASSFLIIPQTWSYGGIPLGVSLLELAATHPDYRGRGLLRKQLEVLVAGSTRRGDLIQGMTDVLFFKDDIGFLPGVTQRAGRGGHTRDLLQTQSRHVDLRPARIEDVPFLAAVENQARERALLSCMRNDEQWRHELQGHSVESMIHNDIRVIELGQEPIGFLVLGYGGIPSFPIPSWLPGRPCPENVVSVTRFEIMRGKPWHDVTFSVLDQLTAHMDGYMLWLGTEHPTYNILGTLLVRNPPRIGWFLRVPDMVALLQAVTPVLENRLRGTAAESFSGQLRLSLYNHGIEIRFSEGSIIDVNGWPSHNRRDSDASLPTQMFQQLLFGQAAWEELEHAFPDSRVHTNLAKLLIPVLFPKMNSDIWPFL
ncbi:GNAT family N-acetyltransferase [Streptomyces sp. 1222.5]|uniref:GNAT family N-acetyltransferase n=1 Tax=Streptomyces sp. 1222.5 TaxID=1881026 RepID=UPI003EBF4FD7